MLKRKLCVIWIWYLLYDNARFQRWLARHRRHGWELADVGFLFFRFERGDGTRYRYYMQMMRDDPDTERGRDYLAGVEELGVTCLGCFWHRAFFRWEDDGRPVEMFSDLASQALEAKCVRSAQLAAAVWCAVNAALLQEVGVDAAHIAVGLRQGEGLRLRCGRLCLFERSTVLTPQQK